MKQGETDPTLVQQLMFNRVLAFVQSLRYERVSVSGYDAKTGTVLARLGGVNFVVNVSLVAEDA